MKKAVSKRNNKTYFKTVANFVANGNRNFVFIENGIYWVRKAEETDNVDPEKFVIVKGTFFSHTDNWKVESSTDPVTLANGYNGTYVMDTPIEKETAKLVLSYTD